MPNLSLFLSFEKPFPKKEWSLLVFPLNCRIMAPLVWLLGLSKNRRDCTCTFHILDTPSNEVCTLASHLAHARLLLHMYYAWLVTPILGLKDFS